MNETPPLDPRPGELVLFHEPFTRRFEVCLPGGDSYRLRAGPLRSFLQRLGVEQAVYIMDVVWNFHAVHVNVDSGSFKIVPSHAAREVLQDERQRATGALVPSAG